MSRSAIPSRKSLPYPSPFGPWFVILAAPNPSSTPEVGGLINQGDDSDFCERSENRVELHIRGALLFQPRLQPKPGRTDKLDGSLGTIIHAPKKKRGRRPAPQGALLNTGG